MGTQKNRLNETGLLSTQNICLTLWARKYLQFYAENFCLSKSCVRGEFLIYGNKCFYYIQREARNHFNCPTLEGAELEDQVPNGTAYTHWEKRVFEVSSNILANAYLPIIIPI